MNVISEQQARARQLALPRDGLLTGVSDEFIAELQLNGTFVEYNQQTVISAGQPAEYIFCVISGRVELSRRAGPLDLARWRFGPSNGSGAAATRRSRNADRAPGRCLRSGNRRICHLCNRQPRETASAARRPAQWRREWRDNVWPSRSRG